MIRRCNSCNQKMHVRQECQLLGGHHVECCKCYPCKYHGRTHNFQCKRDRPIHFINNQPDFFPGSNFVYTKSRRLIAAEIEVAHLVNKDPAHVHEFNEFVMEQGLSVVRDGSLIYDDSFEINTNPSSGNMFTKHIIDIMDIMDPMIPTIDHHCGLHIHVDARDYNIKDIYKFYTAWLGIEPYMKYVFPGRFSNETCKPIGRSFVKSLGRATHANVREMKKTFHKLLYGTYPEPDNRIAQIRQRRPQIRYYSVNLHSLLYRGTIEFRFHPGSIITEDIIHWGIICASIVDFVKNTDMENIRVMLGLERDFDLVNKDVTVAQSRSFYEFILERKHTNINILEYAEKRRKA